MRMPRDSFWKTFGHLCKFMAMPCKNNFGSLMFREETSCLPFTYECACFVLIFDSQIFYLERKLEYCACQCYLSPVLYPSYWDLFFCASITPIGFVFVKGADVVIPPHLSQIQHVQGRPLKLHEYECYWSKLPLLLYVFLIIDGQNECGFRWDEMRFIFLIRHKASGCLILSKIFGFTEKIIEYTNSFTLDARGTLVTARFRLRSARYNIEFD